MLAVPRLCAPIIYEKVELGLQLQRALWSAYFIFLITFKDNIKPPKTQESQQDWKLVMDLKYAKGQKNWEEGSFPWSLSLIAVTLQKILSPLETSAFLHFLLLFLLCPCFLHKWIIRTFSASVLWWSWETLAGNISTVAINMSGNVNLNWKRHLWSSFNFWMEKKG